jgi:hypothetical protein
MVGPLTLSLSKGGPRFFAIKYEHVPAAEGGTDGLQPF